MAGAHDYYLLSSKFENRVQVIINYDESMVPAAPRSCGIEVDPSESELPNSQLKILRRDGATFTDTDNTEPHAPRAKTPMPPSTPNIPRPRLRMVAGFAASSDASGKTHDARNRRNRQMAKVLDAIEAVRLKGKSQRRHARRIRHEQMQKDLRTEVWALRQRALDMERRADEVEKSIRRKMKDEPSESESESESESMDNEEDAMSQISHASTEVHSESEAVKALELQGLGLHVVPMATEGL
jgi:hypothetical protein